jgi:ribonuclease BN (tRNA processing enzyme)
LILLGTSAGSPPNPFRSACANLVVVDGVPYVVDCGNGVARQMVKAGVSVADAHHIFITHHHSDHTADYGNLLQLGAGAGRQGRVDAFGPPPLKRMTEQFFDMIRPEMENRIKDGVRPYEKDIIVHEVEGPGLVHRDERVTVTAGLVFHPPVTPAFAYRFDTPDRSITFSGDTGYWEDLAKLAMDTDILVHEVQHMTIMEEYLRKGGRNRDPGPFLKHMRETHTSPEDAGRIATLARAKKLVFSHIGPQTNPPIPDQVFIDAARATYSGEIVVASDLMVI